MIAPHAAVLAARLLFSDYHIYAAPSEVERKTKPDRPSAHDNDGGRMVHRCGRHTGGCGLRRFHKGWRTVGKVDQEAYFRRFFVPGRCSPSAEPGIRGLRTRRLYAATNFPSKSINNPYSPSLNTVRI